MLVEQTQGREKDPRAKATWLHTTFTSTQHFLQERWDRASKQHSPFQTASQSAHVCSCTALSSHCFKSMRDVIPVLSWPVSQAHFSRIRVSSDSWLSENKHWHRRVINSPFGPDVLRSNCSNMSFTEAVFLTHNPVDLMQHGRIHRSRFKKNKSENNDFARRGRDRQYLRTLSSELGRTEETESNL